MLKFLVNAFSWLLGISFNALIFVALAWGIQHFALEGFAWGEAFSDSITYIYEDYDDIEFVLAEETSVEEVAEMLHELGIVPHALLFRLEMFIMGHTADYSPGTFMLNPNLSSSRVNARLRARPVEPLVENRVRIPEGFTQRDIAVYLEHRGFFTAEEFMYVANNHDFGFHFLNDLPNRASRLEGYLFPDTYFVSENPTPVEVITNMLVRFNEIFNFEYRMRAEELGRSMDEIVNIASMIEREVRVPEERPMVARVIYNRLASGMPLQIDASIHYAWDRHFERTLYQHLEIDSPYNTYRFPGLPLGPISNPGAASIHAALFPAHGDWLFYVLMDLETGRHAFSNTYAEHQHLVANYMPRPWED